MRNFIYANCQRRKDNIVIRQIKKIGKGTTTNQEKTVTMQPSQSKFIQPPEQPEYGMPTPDPIEGVPAGLESLNQLDQLLVKQDMGISGRSGNAFSNRYTVQNLSGQECYQAVEESELLPRIFCHWGRSFKIHIKDRTGRSVIEIDKSFNNIYLACFPSHRFKMTIKAPLTGEILGFVKQERLCAYKGPLYSVYDKENNLIFTIRSPKFFSSEFAINDSNGIKCGSITGTRLSNPDFILSFPLDLDVQLKATLLGVVFMIDCMFYQGGQGGVGGGDYGGDCGGD